MSDYVQNVHWLLSSFVEEKFSPSASFGVALHFGKVRLIERQSLDKFPYIRFVVGESIALQDHF